MRHNHRTHLEQPAVADRSPIVALDAAFATLSRGIRPVTLPAALVNEEPAAGHMTVEEVRSRLVHPSCAHEQRDRVWSEVVFRTRIEGEPWTTVALGLLVPGLRRVLTRLPRLPFPERCELEQEMLTTLVAELAEVDPGEAQIARRLLRAADRTAHRHHYQARTTARHRDDRAPKDSSATVPGPDEWPTAAGDADEYTVLSRAVDQQLVDYASAELIARTRLEGASVDELAAELGRSRRTIFRQRATAEATLRAALLPRPARRPNE